MTKAQTIIGTGGAERLSSHDTICLKVNSDQVSMWAISGGRLDVASIIRKCIIDKNKGTHRMKNANSIKRAPVRLISLFCRR